MTNKRLMLTILTLLTLACAGFAVAQTGTMDHPQPNQVAPEKAALEPGVQTVTGLVQSFDNDHLVIRTSEGEKTFLVLSSTVRPATIQANLPVIISYVTESGGDRAVRVVENTHASAESETPGGQTAGNGSWPGAAHADDQQNAGSGTVADSGQTGTTGTTGATSSTYESGSTSTQTETTGTTGQDTTGTMEHHDTMGTTPTGTTGSTYGTTGTTASSDTTADQTGTAGSTYSGGSLPKTGSDAPAFGLIGLLALAGAAGLHACGRHG